MIPLETECWSSVEAIMLPLLETVPFTLVSQANVKTYGEARDILLSRYGKKKTHITQELV